MRPSHRTRYAIVALPTITPPSGKGLSAEGGRLPTARISLEDSRLNVRAGPDASQRVIAKAFPEELYTLLGVSEDGQWVQIELPDVNGGFGWAAAEYLQTDADLSTLPISNAVSSAPAFRPGDETWLAQPVADATAAVADGRCPDKRTPRRRPSAHAHGPAVAGRQGLPLRRTA